MPAVKATGQAMATAATPTSALPTPFPTPMRPAAATVAPPPAPVPPEQYATMSEEELAAYIDQAVAAAVAETMAASTSANTTAADDAVNQAEYDEARWPPSTKPRLPLSPLKRLVTADYDLYGEVAAETLAVLQAIEQDLQAMNATLTAINETLIVISASLQQGVALAEDTITQLEAAAQQAKAAADATQAKAQTWLTEVTANLDRRASDVQAAKPTDVANTAAGRCKAPTCTWNRCGLRWLIKRSHLMSWRAFRPTAPMRWRSLKSVGGAELQGVADSIAAMTNQLARGQSAPTANGPRWIQACCRFHRCRRSPSRRGDGQQWTSLRKRTGNELTP